MLNDDRDKEWYYLIPIMGLVMFVPLIVRLKQIPLIGESYEFWNGQKISMDFFSYNKMIWIIILTVFSAVMLFIKYYQNNFQILKKTRFYIPMVTYSICAILSTMMADHKKIATQGFVERYEGVYVLLAYMIIVFVVINIVEGKKHIKMILGVIFISAAIIGIIGLLQYMGYDIWNTDIGRKMILPSKYDYSKVELKLATNKGMIYSTLYHYNYVGSYMAMLFPMTFILFLLSKKKKVKVIMLILTILMLLNLFACGSRAGVVGSIFAMIVMIIMLRKYAIKHMKKLAILCVVFMIILLGVDKASNNQILNRVRTLKDNIQLLMKGSNKTETEAKLNIPLRNVTIDGNVASIITTTETLEMVLESGELSFKDGANGTLQINYDEAKNEIIVMDDRYKQYQLSLSKLNGQTVIMLNKESIKLFFLLGEKEINLINQVGKKIRLQPTEMWGFEGKERLASSRGYIWSRSIPLLKETILLGHGPDTFAAYFPQNDFKGKMYAYYGDMWQLVDKPHDFYLQTAINTGVISLLALITLFVLYFIDSIKIYNRREVDDFYYMTGLSCFIAVCGYLGAAIFNDSVVSVAPVFWAILGLGISINITLKSTGTSVKKNS